MIKRIIMGTLDDNVFKRIACLYVSFFIIFYIVMVTSYFFLPEGLLKGKHPIINLLETPSSFWRSTFQIFFYNMIPACLLMVSSFIAEKSRIVKEKFIPISYYCFWVLISNFAVILGTWSFSSNRPPKTLVQRLLHTFDIYHNSGLIEISAYIFIVAVSYRFSIRYSDGKKIISSKKIKEINLYKKEKVVLIIAFFLLFLAAMVESYSLVK